MTLDAPHSSALDPADHGGGVDAARLRWGGARAEWLDLSTGINPHAYPLPVLAAATWTTLPDTGAERALIEAARRHWGVPDAAAVLAAPGTSALIARLPSIALPGTVRIPAPSYNEHARAFAAAGWRIAEGAADAMVTVNPNNPDGRLWEASDLVGGLRIIDESFADTDPATSLIGEASHPGTLILKGLGKFWGLAGLRLGFAIGDPALVAQLARALGPWPVSGPALAVGRAALEDLAWAEAMRARLRREMARLDSLLGRHGARIVGGTSLFRLAEVPEAAAWQEALARQRIWTRIFPYSRTWVRFGLPGCDDDWARLAHALETIA